MSLSRRNPRRDANERAIIDALEAMGFEVTQVSGEGAPDLIVRRGGWFCATCGRNVVAFEVKTKTGKPTKAQLNTPWPIVRSVDEAIAVTRRQFPQDAVTAVTGG